MAKKTCNVNTTHQSLTPEQQEQQLIYLEPFYDRLIGMTFEDSSIAIEQCRELCAEYGFTVKQEASTHRNIYVYCSREGLPDSLRNPKSNPQRKRPSKRCDCRWRVVLYENEQYQWEFRKSLNPEAGKHNHELMNPDEIERSWPKEVTDLICELARQRLTTQDIRNKVREQFPNLHWNERRFYNRLSEERQKIKLRDTVDRTMQLNQIWSQVCTASAGNDDMFQYVKQELNELLQSICDTSQIELDALPPPLIEEESTPHKSANQNAPKGYLSIEIPKQVCYIRIHNQRQLNDAQVLRKRHNRDEHLDTSRKISRKGKGRQMPNNLDMMIPCRSTHTSTTSTTALPGNMLVPITPRQQPIHTQTTFIYYDSSMSIDTSSLNYSFQNNYSPNPTPGFNDMSFTFENDNPNTATATAAAAATTTTATVTASNSNSNNVTTNLHSKEQTQTTSHSSPSSSTAASIFNLPMYPKE